MARILVIDDEEVVRSFLSRLLERQGHTVETAEDGEAGFRAYQASSPDLVITDIIMPGEEGIGFILRLKEQDPEARIIAISGGGRMGPESYLPIAADLGAARTFTKPLDPGEFLQAVQDLLPQEP